MAISDMLFGRMLASDEEGEQRVGVLAGIPMLGLDALSSSAYGPEAALTLLIPLGTAGLGYIGPISALIIALLLVVYFSYRQTIVAYPHGGGSYTVLQRAHPNRDIAVIVPELVATRWYHYVLHNQTAALIKAYLL